MRNVVVALLLAVSVTAMAQKIGIVNAFPATEKGYEKGVSACYAGWIGDRLLIAGGCNFPDTPAADGGKKVYYRGIYMASPRDWQWTQVGMLPEGSAYGASVQMGNAIILIGGNNQQHGIRNVYRISRKGNGLQTDTLPSLPHTIDNMAATAVGNTIYIIGGNVDGKPSAAVFRLRHNASQWESVGSVPGKPRVQPVCASAKGKIYIFGGFYANGEQSEVAVDGWCYDTRRGEWSALEGPKAEDGKPLTLSGATATAIGSRIYCTGGVNHDIFLDAISGKYQLTPQAEYQRHAAEWYKFNDRLLVYDTQRSSWSPITTRNAALARAGATPTARKGRLYLVGGELKPGIRMPMVAVVAPGK